MRQPDIKDYLVRVSKRNHNGTVIIHQCSRCRYSCRNKQMLPKHWEQWHCDKWVQTDPVPGLPPLVPARRNQGPYHKVIENILIERYPGLGMDVVRHIVDFVPDPKMFKARKKLMEQWNEIFGTFMIGWYKRNNLVPVWEWQWRSRKDVYGWKEDKIKKKYDETMIFVYDLTREFGTRIYYY